MTQIEPNNNDIKFQLLKIYKETGNINESWN
jgi:hypothetical protein